MSDDMKVPDRPLTLGPTDVATVLAALQMSQAECRDLRARAERAERERDWLAAILDQFGAVTVAKQVDVLALNPADSDRHGWLLRGYPHKHQGGVTLGAASFGSLLAALRWLHSPEGRAECERVGVKVDE